MPLSQTGAELLFEVFSQRYERGSTIVTSNLPFDEWTSVFASERLTGALLDRLTHHVHILEMNGDSYRLKQSKRRQRGTRSDPRDENRQRIKSSPASPRLIHVGAQEPPTAVTACASERAVPAAGPSYALRG